MPRTGQGASVIVAASSPTFMEAGEKSVAITIDTIESLPLSETLIDIRALFLQGSVLLTAS
jgi:hypothetical protein